MARRRIETAALKTGQSIPQDQGPVDAAAVYEAGAVLIIVSSELEEGGANPVNIAGIANHKNPPTNTPSETGLFVPALSYMRFVASIDDSSALDTGAIAATDLYTAYGITEDSNGVWYIDKNKTAAATVRVRIIDFQDAIGTVNGRVVFQFLPIVDLGGTPTAVTIYAGN